MSIRPRRLLSLFPSFTSHPSLQSSTYFCSCFFILNLWLPHSFHFFLLLFPTVFKSILAFLFLSLFLPPFFSFSSFLLHFFFNKHRSTGSLWKLTPRSPSLLCRRGAVVLLPSLLVCTQTLSSDDVNWPGARTTSCRFYSMTSFSHCIIWLFWLLSSSVDLTLVSSNVQHHCCCCCFSSSSQKPVSVTAAATGWNESHRPISSLHIYVHIYIHIHI